MNKTLILLGTLFGLGLGGTVGFFLGVYSTEIGKELLEDILTSEEPADVSRPQTISRKTFKMQYPGNWKLDTKGEDYDPDHLVQVRSPGSSFMMIILYDSSTDPKDNLEGQIETFVPSLFKDPKRIPFKKWGRYSGEGVDLKGKVVLGIPQGGVRLFSHSSKSISFVVVEYYDDDIAYVRPGFRLIESTFKLID